MPGEGPLIRVVCAFGADGIYVDKKTPLCLVIVQNIGIAQGKPKRISNVASRRP